MKINPRQILADIAAGEVGVRETGRNQGPGIAKYWPATNYPNGYTNREPYCAAFVCWVIQQAMQEGHALGLTASSRPRDAAVRNLVAWSRKDGSGARIILPSKILIIPPAAGDLIYFAFGGSTPNHIGIVAGPAVNGIIPTIEANTGALGERDGDGVWRKSRRVNLAAGYIRLAWRAGNL
jgi:hypothetical protein